MKALRFCASAGVAATRIGGGGGKEFIFIRFSRKSKHIIHRPRRADPAAVVVFARDVLTSRSLASTVRFFFSPFY